MDLKTLIFIGRSGAGKGTQADLAAHYIRLHDEEHSVFRLETGQRFRDFIKKNTYTSNLAHVIYGKGGLMPEFLSMAMWANALIDDLKADQHIIIDGSPRKPLEAHILDSALKFYKRGKPSIVFIDVSREWATERLKERHRFDDTVHDIDARMNWFDQDVLPTIENYRANPDYQFFDINGEQAIEDVQKEITSKVLS